MFSDVNASLSIVPMMTAPPCDKAGFCIYRAGEDYFGLPLQQVEEVISQPTIADLPAAGPPFLLGTINASTETVPVIDLAMSANLPDPKYVIILRIPSDQGAVRIAMAADEILCPGAQNAPGAELQLDPIACRAAFLAGRIGCGGITAWALDPGRLMMALLSPVLD